MTVRASDLKRPLASRLREDRERLRVQGSTATLARSGMSVTAEDEVTVDGDFIVNGDLNVHGAAAFDGNTTIGGNAAITGTLSLPAGIINNDALANPVVPGVANIDADTFSLGNAFTEKVGLDLTVPSGCTKLLATCSVWLQALNPNTTGGSNGAGADYIYAYARVGSTIGDYKATGVSGSNGTASTAAGLSALLSGLTPGGTVRIGGWCSSQYTTIGASGNNRVTLSASLIWLR